MADWQRAQPRAYAPIILFGRDITAVSWRRAVAAATDVYASAAHSSRQRVRLRQPCVAAGRHCSAWRFRRPRCVGGVKIRTQCPEKGATR